MNEQSLFERFQVSPLLKLMADRISMSHSEKTGSIPFQVFLQNLYGSSPAFILQSVFVNPATQHWNHLVVLNDAEEAAYFFNSIESITEAMDLFYFPSSFKTPHNFNLLNPSHVMLRTEALTKISMGGNKKILVTYPEALFEKVILPKTLQNNIIQIKTNDHLEVNTLLQQLVDYGFDRTDFVYEPGQFAVRGGILDIYSFGNEKPYRIELFGEEVDSIRLFDPASQLSERKLLQVNIIPNVTTQFEQTEQIPLLDFISKDTLIWLKDWNVIKQKGLDQYELLHDFLEHHQNNSVIEIDAHHKRTKISDLVVVEETEQQLMQRSIIEWGFQPQLTHEKIVFNTQVQPAFNRQFQLLIENVQSYEKKGYAIFIFAEQAKQLERLHAIFTDLKTEIQFTPIVKNIHEGFIDHDHKIVCYTDHQIFQRYHKYKVKQAYSKSKAITLRTLRDLQPGDYVTHIDHGVGVYSGLQKMEVNGLMQEAVRIIYKDSDILYVNINSLHKISKYTGKEGSPPKVNKLGSDAWVKLKDKTKAKVKEIAFDLIKLYAQRKAQSGFAFSPDNYMVYELEASFMYEETLDQSKAIADVKKDMEGLAPMDRLVCGDVGFGKTEVAVRAAFKAAIDGKQVALLVPTTILAFQHYKTFVDRLKDFPITVDYLNRFKSSAQKKETIEKVKQGKIDILVGTHGVLGKEVQFKDLGLMIIDEEQKFGVGHKEKLKTLKTTVDCLTLTATPIPRTLHFSLMGARDLSIINTAPANRQPIHTEVQVFNEDVIRETIYFETERGGQVFFIHNRVQGLAEMCSMIQSLCPDLSIGYAHGQLEGHLLEEKILDFIERRYDVLVCTNIVESGVDIPNVNTIIINNAHQFGLSDLHQLRGRVGRSNKKAFCYLLAPPISTLPDDSRKRLQTLEQFSELGSGFQIAMRDLDIRGAGNLLGGEQSGFMVEIGFEMYQKILAEAVRELKRSDFKELFKEEISQQDDFVQDCTIDTDLEIMIPDAYVESIGERLSLYTRMDQTENEEDLELLRVEMADRFGPIPAPVEDLFTTIKCRKLAIALGFEKMTLKDTTLRCFFINRPDSPYFESNIFKQLLLFAQTNMNNAHFKQVGKNFILIIKEVKSMNDCHRILTKINNGVLVATTH
ncbi:MAG: transcription-repair coupling factor [Chitinophagia bacterium]|jgi:transcription-repair coupling factor (superfamily II helicase)|nr:transcription-repair coupling factor [Chitinophagia bacterium]